MNLRALRRWHWILLGSVIGLLIGWARLLSGLDEPIGGKGFMTQRDFEYEVVAPATSLGPLLDDIVIHPSRVNGHIDLITLTRIDVEMRFAAPRPYTPIGKSVAPAQNYTVRDYLSSVAATHPAVTFREAWWEAPAPVMAFWWLIGVILFGEICPTLLRLTAGKQASEGVKLDHSKGAPSETIHSDEAIEENSLDGMGDDETFAAPTKQTEVPTAAAAAIVQLDKTPLKDSEPSEKPQVEYEGQYYPVEKHHSRGFSLVELLVVMGIIALLISMLLPVMRVVRAQAQTTQCASQLRQVGMALHMYANSNGGWLPAWSGWHTWRRASDGTVMQTEGPAWTVELIPYIGNPDSPVYNCPAFPNPMRCRNYFLESQWSGRSGRNAMKLADITMGGRFVLSGDKTNMAAYPDGSEESRIMGDDSDPDDFGSVCMLLWPWTGGIYMHRTGNNVLFDDNHVGFFSAFDPGLMTFNPHRMESWEGVTPN